jgi:hypothetical protein
MPVNESQQVNEFLLAAIGVAAAIALLGNGLSKIAETTATLKKNWAGVNTLFNGDEKEKDKDEKELKNLLKKKPEDLSPKEQKRLKELSNSVDSDALNSKEKEALDRALGKTSGDDDKDNEETDDKAEKEYKLSVQNTAAVMMLVQKKLNSAGTPEDKAKLQKMSMLMFDKNGDPVTPENFIDNANNILGEGGLDKLAKDSAEALKDSNISFDDAVEESNKLDPVEKAQLMTQSRSEAVNGHYKSEAERAQKDNEEQLKKLEEERDKAIEAANKLKTAERDAAIEAANKEYNDKKKAQEDTYKQRVEQLDNDRKSAVEKTIKDGTEKENVALESKIAEKRNAAGDDPEALKKVEDEAKQMREDLKKAQDKMKNDAVEGGSVKEKPKKNETKQIGTGDEDIDKATEKVDNAIAEHEKKIAEADELDKQLAKEKDPKKRQELADKLDAKLKECKLAREATDKALYDLGTENIKKEVENYTDECKKLEKEYDEFWKNADPESPDFEDKCKEHEDKIEAARKKLDNAKNELDQRIADNKDKDKPQDNEGDEPKDAGEDEEDDMKDGDERTDNDDDLDDEEFETKDGKLTFSSKQDPRKVWKQRSYKRGNKTMRTKSYYSKRGASISKEEFQEKVKAYEKANKKKNENLTELGYRINENRLSMKYMSFSEYIDKHR